MLRSRLLLVSLLLVLLFSSVLAQRGGDDEEDEETTAPATNTRTQQAATTPTRITTATRPAATTATRTQNDDEEEEDEDEPVVSNLPPATTSTPTTRTTAAAVVTITGANTITDDSTPAEATSDGPPAAFGIPTVTPPSIKGSPFLQQSDLPEGTVFIGVGAALAVFGLIVILWRAIIAWMLHRSMHNPSSKPGIIDTKSMQRSYKNGGGGGGFYAAGAGSMHSLDHLASSNRSPGIPPPNASLFFSPTSSNLPPSTAGTGDRRSAYLPPGFYSAGNRKSTAISNSSQTQFQRIRGSGISPPGTPLMAPTSRGQISSAGTERLAGMRINDSQTSLNLPPTGRAPSAYLEDLFESHPIPEQHPPPPMPHHGRF